MRHLRAGTGPGIVPQITPEKTEEPMTYDMSTTLMTVIGVLAAIGALLYVMAVLDPTSTPKPSHRAERRRVES